VESGRKLLEEMICSADVLIDPFRPGVLERLGLGPRLFLGDGKTKGLNERLIYARIVGCVPFFHFLCRPGLLTSHLAVFPSQVYSG